MIRLIKVIGNGLNLLVRGLSNVMKKNVVNKSHLKLLRESLNELDALVTLDYEELSLLSLNYSEKRVKKSSKRFVVGIFYSIFHEHLINYTVLKYKRNKKLIVVRTANMDIYYATKGEDWLIFCDDKFLGLLDLNGRMFATNKRKQLIAKIDNSKTTLYQRIYFQHRLVASLNNPYKENSVPKRVFHTLDIKNKSERAYVISLAVLNMILRKREKRFKLFQ